MLRLFRAIEETRVEVTPSSIYTALNNTITFEQDSPLEHFRRAIIILNLKLKRITSVSFSYRSKTSAEAIHHIEFTIDNTASAQNMMFQIVENKHTMSFSSEIIDIRTCAELDRLSTLCFEIRSLMLPIKQGTLDYDTLAILLNNFFSSVKRAFDTYNEKVRFKELNREAVYHGLHPFMSNFVDVFEIQKEKLEFALPSQPAVARCTS
jgi:hypothetical protein